MERDEVRNGRFWISAHDRPLPSGALTAPPRVPGRPAPGLEILSENQRINKRSLPDIGLVGAPTSAGAHWRGQEMAPGHLRNAGLVEKLGRLGRDVHEYGDLGEAVVCRLDKAHRREQNVDAVVEVYRRVEDGVGAVVADRRLPLVVGGDCTITVGVVAVLARSSPAWAWPTSTAGRI